MSSKKKAMTVKQAQALDRRASEKLGIPSLVLMENAGRGAADEIQKFLGKKKGGVVIVCGPGNNGGDGFVVARHLSIAGLKAQVVLIGKDNALKGDALLNYRILKRIGVSVKAAQTVTPGIKKILKQASCVVDAIFGIGLNRNVGCPFDAFIDAMNAYAKYVIALDIPSGLDGTSGKVYGVCVNAHKTVTFHAPKKGLLKGKGPEYAGRVIVKHIGF